MRQLAVKPGSDSPFAGGDSALARFCALMKQADQFATEVRVNGQSRVLLITTGAEANAKALAQPAGQPVATVASYERE